MGCCPNYASFQGAPNFRERIRDPERDNSCDNLDILHLKS